MYAAEDLISKWEQHSRGDHMEKAAIGEDIRWVFVSFLYTVVASDIASKISRVFCNWEKMAIIRRTALSHLALAAVVVITSWLGWSLGTASGSYARVTEVISRPTLLLLMDFILLVLYYVLESGIEVEGIKPQDAAHVSLWCMVIMFGYVVWNIIIRFVGSSPGVSFFGQISVSFGCAMLSSVAFYLFKRMKSAPPCSVLAADVALISLFLLFRAMKQDEFLHTRWEPQAKELTPPLDATILFARIMFFVFIVATILASLRNQRCEAPGPPGV